MDRAPDASTGLATPSSQTIHTRPGAHVICIPCVLATPCFSAFCVHTRKPLSAVPRKPPASSTSSENQSSRYSEITIIITFHRAAQSIYFKGKYVP